MGDGDVPHGTPQADFAVGIVIDGEGDIAHGCS
jgi:hypothetical protein